MHIHIDTLTTHQTKLEFNTHRCACIERVFLKDTLLKVGANDKVNNSSLRFILCMLMAPTGAHLQKDAFVLFMCYKQVNTKKSLPAKLRQKDKSTVRHTYTPSQVVIFSSFTVFWLYMQELGIALTTATTGIYTTPPLYNSIWLYSAFGSDFARSIAQSMPIGSDV